MHKSLSFNLLLGVRQVGGDSGNYNCNYSKSKIWDIVLLLN